MTHRFLTTPLRKALEKDIKRAREIAEEGVVGAIARLGVAAAEAPAHLNEADKLARRRLRAHARALGDHKNGDDTHTIDRLIEAAAYAQWHRRLFARFLAERNLLRHPEHGVPVTLDEVEELAVEEGYSDGWSAAEAYAARMLPAVFQPDDPVLAVTLAPEHAQALRKLVLGIDAETFQSDDALGWTYQFWRALEKDRVNKAGSKIGAAELPAVTQLFTEPYMVRFLLHNTLGAWWAGKVLAQKSHLSVNAANEDELRAAVALPGYDFDMLRFIKEGEETPRWRPAAGAYPGWPTEAGKLTVLDPCCGSGHFLTEAMTILTGLRAAEEGLSPSDAVAAVLRDNLFGLELDGRCVQIAAFAVALTAWKVGGFQTLPAPHIAWVGAPPPLPKPEFIALANGEVEFRDGLDKLWDVFAQAPLLGSLIEPTGGDLMSPQRLGQIEPLLTRLVTMTRAAEPERAEGAVAARGMADAAAILSGRYVLVSTNVPYLGRGKQCAQLADHISANFADSKADLATAILVRSKSLLKSGGSFAAVMKQEWLFLHSFKKLRSIILRDDKIEFLATLGEEAWVHFGDRGPLALLICISARRANGEPHFSLDLTQTPSREAKIRALEGGPITILTHGDHERRSDFIITPNHFIESDLLSKYCRSVEGLSTGDGDRYIRSFWELDNLKGYSFYHGTPEEGDFYSGMSTVVRWEDGKGTLASEPGARIQGQAAWGRVGVLVGMMRNKTTSIYTGEIHEKITAALIPKDSSDALPVYTYLQSQEYRDALKVIDNRHSVATATLVKVPFDIAHWRREAAERYPRGLPAPRSDDPCQWLFHGHPAQAEIGTAAHIALARLAGYRWPAETDPEMRLSAEARDWVARAATLPHADPDGLLTVPAGGGDRPLTDRLREHLAAAFGSAWNESLERRLIAEADEKLDKKAAKEGSLDAWLRDRAFRQHCRLFHDRPFLWQVWDGQKDGFSAFLHYHRLDHGTLQKLTYTVLGDWIARRANEGDDRRVEAAKILQMKLEAILEGEAPYDIFTRWKLLAQQPLGWNPDFGDGVRFNIRPWVEAEVLREIPRIKWGVDRGNDVASAPWFKLDLGKRNNDRHTSLAEKQVAREAAGGKAGAA